MLVWAIEDIVSAHPGLYLEHCAAMAVEVMSRRSESPCEFSVECDGFSPPSLHGETHFRVSVSWTEQSMARAARIRRTEQSNPIVERAAVALAALAFAKLIPGGEMRVTRHGDRADYWLPRLSCALEVSGTEDPRTLTRRERAKVAQVLQNPLQWNGHVFICCFAPERSLIRWSYHTQRARTHEPF